MRAPAFTPGPWRASFNNHFWQINDAEDHEIADTCASCVSPWGSLAIGEANARLIAAAPDLYEALAGLEFFYAREGENNVDRFERVAERFYRETGLLAPGKDASPLSGQPEREERRRLYDAWIEARVSAARAALAKGDANV